MKKIIFLAAIAAVALVSCAKESATVNDKSSDLTGKTLVIGATLSPDTRLDYTATDAGGYKLTFSTTDYIVAYFKKNDGSGTNLGSFTMNIDPSTISSDKRSASFKVEDVVIPEAADTVFACLIGDNSYYNAGGMDLTSQTGKEADALRNCIIFGYGHKSDITSSDNVNHLKIAFNHSTSIFKFVLTLPDGASCRQADSTSASEIKISSAASTIHNNIKAAWGLPNASATFGDITAHASSVDGNVATAYVNLWAADNFSGSTVTVKTAVGTYKADFAPSASIVAGKVYTVPRTLSLSE